MGVGAQPVSAVVEVLEGLPGGAVGLLDALAQRRLRRHGLHSHGAAEESVAPECLDVIVVGLAQAEQTNHALDHGRVRSLRPRLAFQTQGVDALGQPGPRENFTYQRQSAVTPDLVVSDFNYNSAWLHLSPPG